MITLGSLFDGSGGFPLAGMMCGITPVWASEVEPYPIAVTKNRLPNMRHLGDISKINGANILPVDVITFGSPCQDLSVAGKRSGLKHEDNGDDETTRSGLFMEAVRIIKEMRDATHGEYPKYCVWENVPGAFSSNKGQDFKTVLEELIKIVEPNAVMPEVPKGGWSYADSFCGDGWSLSWRVLDSQYIRTAQRRRRIYLVLDLGGQCARKILFERDGLRGHTPSCGTPWQGTSSDAQGSVGADDCKGVVGLDLYNFSASGDKAVTLNANSGMSANHAGPTVMLTENDDEVNSKVFEPKSLLEENWGEAGVKNALRAEASKSSHCVVQCVVETVALEGNGQRPSHRGDGYAVTDKSYTINTTERHGIAYERPIAIDRAFFNQGKNALYEPQTYEDGTNPTIVAKGPSAVCYKAKSHYIVRRLTPTECARLQGFPDNLGRIEKKSDFTDEEYKFWLEVRNTHAAINGRAVKDYTKKQMLTWYNKLHTDSAEYKMWGNGVALPCVLYVLEGIEECLGETHG